MFDSLQSLFDAPSSFQPDDGIYSSVVPVYSHAQAMADGVLIDVSPLAREIGFKDAVALTRRVYADCVTGSPADSAFIVDTDVDICVLNVLLPAVWAMRAQSHRRLREIEFTVLWVLPGSREHNARPVDLKIIAGPGDRGETVLTILSVDED